MAGRKSGARVFATPAWRLVASRNIMVARVLAFLLSAFACAISQADTRVSDGAIHATQSTARSETTDRALQVAVDSPATPSPGDAFGVQPAPRVNGPFAESPWLRGQRKPLVGEARLDATLNRLFTDLAGLTSAPADDRLLAEALGTDCQASRSPEVREALLAARVDDVRRDNGLSFETGARTHTWSEDFGDRSASAYVGLAWDLLRDGRLERQVESAVLAKARQIERLQGARDLRRSLAGCRHTAIIVHFNAQKTRLQNWLERFLDAERELLRGNYFAGSIPLDNVLRWERDLERTRQKLATYAQLGAVPAVRLAEGGVDEPPLLDIDLGRLLDSLAQDPSYEQIATLAREIAESRQAAGIDSRLRVFLRPGVSRVNGGGFERDVALGVTYSTPLFGARSDIRRLEAEQVVALQQDQRRQAADNVLRQYYEFRTVLEDGVKLHFQREEMLERLRRGIVQMNFTAPAGGDLGQLLQAVKELLDTQQELLDNKQRLYVGLLQVLSVSGVDYRPEFVRPVSFEQPSDRLRVGHRAVYLWSDSFNRVDNRFLLDLAASQRWSSLLVSAGRRTDTGKVEALVTAAKANGVEIELVLGDPAWVRRPSATLQDEFAAVYRRVRTLHLDVEPHTLPDWRSRRGEYLERWAGIIEAAAAVRGVGQQLAIALPTHLSASEVERLGRYADRIYVMAYETADVATIVRRLAPFLSLPKERLVIAVRPADFADQMALESALMALRGATGIEHFALHGVDQLLEYSN